MTHVTPLYLDACDLPDDQQERARASRLTFLLERSSIYAKVIGERMERQQIAKQKAEALAAVKKQNKEKKAVEASANGTRGGLRHAHTDNQDKDAAEPARGKRKAKETNGRGAKKAKVDDEVRSPCSSQLSSSRFRG